MTNLCVIAVRNGPVHPGANLVERNGSKKYLGVRVISFHNDILFIYSLVTLSITTLNVTAFLRFEIVCTSPRIDCKIAPRG